MHHFRIDANMPCTATQWIGIKDSASGTNFTNVDGTTPTYFQWNNGYPFCNVTTSCILNQGWGFPGWITDNCSSNNPFVCQYRLAGKKR